MARIERIANRADIPDYCAEISAITGGNADADLCDRCPGPCHLRPASGRDDDIMAGFVVAGIERGVQ